MAGMLVPTLVMAVLAVVLLALAYSRGRGEHAAGLRAGGTMLVQVLPLLFFAFIVAGVVQILIPREAIARWIGVESGLRGILLATVVGGITPGGPYVSLPIVAGLMRSGASFGVTVAFLTSWSLWAIARAPMEVGLLGWKFTAVRLASSFFFPPIAGLIANRIHPG